MSLYTISAFADEIGPDPELQVSILGGAGVHRIEFRSILSTNVLVNSVKLRTTFILMMTKS